VALEVDESTAIELLAAEPEINPLNASIMQLIAGLLGNPRMPSRQAFIYDERDLRLWTDGLMESVGRSQGEEHDSKSSPAKAISVGEQVMKMTREEYFSSVYRLWQVNPEIVMFGCAGQPLERVAGGMIVPIMDHVAAAIERGELCPDHVQPEHIVVPSSNLLLMAGHELPQADKRSNRVGLALLQTIMYQGGVLGRVAVQDAHRLRIISFAGYAEARQRLERKKFRATGQKTANTNKDIMIWEVSGRENFFERQEARIFVAMMRGYYEQRYNRDADI
jgi:hypothetical protein